MDYREQARAETGVCYRPDQHPCAVCGVPSDVLWHRHRGAMDPHAPGVCEQCVTSAALAFLRDAAALSSREEGEG